MKRSALGCVCLVSGLLAAAVTAGCDGPVFSPDPYARYKLGPARDTIAASIEAIGGLRAWQKVQWIRATAVVTLYSDGGQAYVNLQEQRIDLEAGRLHAEATTPRGPWQIDADVGGAAKLSGTVVDAERTKRLTGAMVTLIRRLRGPLSFLHGPARTLAEQRVRVAGEDLIRVTVAGDDAGHDACYFNATTSVLRYVTSGGGPGEEQTVTLYTYQVHPNGLAFPQRIRVVKTGKFVLVGETPLLDVEFSGVVFH